MKQYVLDKYDYLLSKEGGIEMNKNIGILQLSYGNYVSLDDYVKLQKRWDSLREYYQRKAEETKDSTALYDKWTKYSSVLDKMNELEGGHNEKN